MKTNNPINNNYIEEDEIDLRELFKTIGNSKTLIISLTMAITILATIYAFTKTPIYEAKTLIEIGNYKLDSNSNSNSNSKVLLNNPSQLAQKLNIIFIDTLVNIKDKKSEIVSITTPKKSTQFLEIKAEAISNELAIKEIENVLKYIQKKDNVILLDVKNRREVEIKNIDAKIKSINEKQIILITNKIKLKINSKSIYKKQLRQIKNTIKRIEKKSPTLAALQIMQQTTILNTITNLEIDILDLKNTRETLETTEISTLIEQKNLLLSMLQPYNYKNSQIVGKILINDFPAKPKKKLIIVVAFITGLILSIFLVFFLNFIHSMKEENSN